MKNETSQIGYNTLGTPATLPEAPELERAVLGALILEVDQLPDVMEIVEIWCLSEPNNGKIFGEMVAMFRENEKIDLFSLIQRLKNKLDGVNVAGYLSGLTTVVGSGANVLDHARQLREIAERRRLILLGYELAGKVGHNEHTAAELGEWVAKKAEEITTRATRNDIAPLSSVVRATLNDLEQRQQARQDGACVGIPTGLQRLDALTGGWRAGQLVVLGGRPSMGKSALMLHHATTAARSGIPVCIFSLEMTAEQLAGRMLVGCSGVDSAAFRGGNVNAEGWTRLEIAGDDLARLQIHLNDRPDMSMTAIRTQCKAMARRGECGFVIIDYLQLIDTKNDKKNNNREQDIAAISRAAKLLAKEIGAPVLLLSQLSRKVEERADKMPLLSDLRESGAIEQDADIVIFVWRPSKYGEQTIEAEHGCISSEGVGLLHVAKNRDGGTGKMLFSHNESLTQIKDYATTQKTPEILPF